MILPESWAALLEMFRPVFRRRGTFTVFTVLATGMVAQTGRRTVVGMLSGARMAGTISFHAACRFFSHAVWDVDRLGLIAARLIVERLVAEDEPITVVIDDTLFKRWGRKVFHTFWTHDGAAQGGIWDRTGESVGGGRDRGQAAVVHSAGVPAGVVPAVGG
ncbi:transposase [Saccharopolyspora hattusasensis]|uniref:transposase n=1 Tax=Saccharopolyspora hattusasensis TaxID=1128679 RepID=UPI003D9518A3